MPAVGFEGQIRFGEGVEGRGSFLCPTAKHVGMLCDFQEPEHQAFEFKCGQGWINVLPVVLALLKS